MRLQSFTRGNLAVLMFAQTALSPLGGLVDISGPQACGFMPVLVVLFHRSVCPSSTGLVAVSLL